MKKRTMKKWIHNGCYCHAKINNICKWWSYLGKKNNIKIYNCKYLNYTSDEYDLLWDKCKECGEHDGLKLEKQYEIRSAKRKARINNIKIKIK